MSRFFDALKEASRSQLPANGRPAGGEGALVSNGNELLEGMIASAPVAPPVLTPEPELTPETELPGTPALSLDDEPAELSTEPQHGSFVPKIRIVFDPRARLIVNAVDSVVAEHYRRLRTKIQQQQATKSFRSLIVVSPSPKEGKTVTVLNLGLSFATLPSFRVLIVDGDLRRGNIEKLLGAENQPGLTDVIEGSVRFEDAVLKCDDLPLHFLLHGNSKMPPAELLHSPRLGTQFRRMSEEFDLVLVDSAPVNLISDTQLLAENCDAVLLVARAFSTTRKSMEQAVQDLSPFRIIGTVLNGGPRTRDYRRYKGYY
ncbi:MAG: CpsD/CapB family tyrosine-protein kinase [Candidatus Solibacter sp.]|nr:CpsD/CapB family tyrosine-protein kinase [Candidatus Solibacter sp.]